MDGKSFEETVKEYNLKIISIPSINANQEDQNKKVAKFHLIYLKKFMKLIMILLPRY